MDRYDTLIIGAGLSGLTAASLLAKRGLKVAVIERNFKPGGSCGIFKRNGSTFDQGTAMLYGFGDGGFNPHYFVFNSLEEPIDVIKHDLLYSVNFKGKKIRFFPDVDKFTEELANVFPGQRDNLKRFYSDLKKLYDKVMVKHTAYETPDEANKLLAFKKLLSNPLAYIKFLSFMNKSTKQLLERYFSDPEIFKFFDKLTSTYCYTTVDETPAILSAVMFIDNHVGGSFYTAGSTLFLPGKLEKVIEENNGEMIYEKEAKEIVIENGKAKGVLLEKGKILYGDNIIYSGTVWNLYSRLINEKHSSPERREWARKMSPTYSSMVLYALVDAGVIPADTTPIEMFIGNPDAIDESEITVYILSIDDKTLCPADKHVVAAIGPSFKTWPDSDACGKYRTKKYLEQKQAEAERMIGVLEKNFPGFKKGMKHLEISSPATIERYTMKNWGCVAGPKQSIGQHMFNRLHVKSDWDCLFCCGESCTMGTGSPAVTVSGISAANAVLRKYGKEQFLNRKISKNYVNLIDKPVTINKLHTGNSADEREIILLASECLFCEKPPCMIKFGLDIRGIMRRLAVGNFYGSVKIIKKYSKDNSISSDDIRSSENNCIRLKETGKAVQIEKILRFLIENSGLYTKKIIQT
jgi:prolycopene isomerase